MSSSKPQANDDIVMLSLGASFFNLDDFSEDGSFLVLKMDEADSISRSTIAFKNSTDGKEISGENSSPKANRIDTDPSVNFNELALLKVDQLEAVQISSTDSSLSSTTSASTNTWLAEANTTLVLLMAENKQLKELSEASNEKMKECLATTEKLKREHDEYKRNKTSQEASQKLIEQLQTTLEKTRHERDEAVNQAAIFKERFNFDKKVIAKIDENQEQLKSELAMSKATVKALQVTVQEKEKEMSRLRKNIEERVGVQIGKLNAELAALKMECNSSNNNVQALKIQFETYQSELATVRKECVKHVTEKETLSVKFNASKTQLKEISDAYLKLAYLQKPISKAVGISSKDISEGPIASKCDQQ